MFNNDNKMRRNNKNPMTVSELVNNEGGEKGIER